MENFLNDMLNKTIGQLVGFINSESYGENGKVTNNTIKTQTILIVIMIIMHLLASIKFVIKKCNKWKNKTGTDLSNTI